MIKSRQVHGLDMLERHRVLDDLAALFQDTWVSLHDVFMAWVILRLFLDEESEKWEE